VLLLSWERGCRAGRAFAGASLSYGGVFCGGHYTLWKVAAGIETVKGGVVQSEGRVEAARYDFVWWIGRREVVLWTIKMRAVANGADREGVRDGWTMGSLGTLRVFWHSARLIESSAERSEITRPPARDGPGKQRSKNVAPVAPMRGPAVSDRPCET